MQLIFPRLNENTDSTSKSIKDACQIDKASQALLMYQMLYLKLSFVLLIQYKKLEGNSKA